MSLNTVCRVCLTMDVPMHSISESPLRDVYEKLTSISINTAHRPVVACYICCSQLRKCHNLMVRSLRAENVLGQLFLSDNIVKGDSMNMLNREALRYTLSMTPINLIAFTGIKEEPQLSLYNEGREEDRPASAEDLKFWESDDEDHTERERLVEIEDEDIKQEELDPLSMSAPVEYIHTKEITIGGNIKSERAENVKNENSMGASEPAEKYLHEENKQDENTLTPGGKNILNKPRSRRPRPCEDDEPTSKHLLRNTEKTANNRQVSINTTVHSDTAINKSDVDVDSDNDCTGANTDVDNDNTSSKDLRRMFICNYCGNVFDDQYLLIEHIEHHMTNKKRIQKIPVVILRKQRLSKTSVTYKHTETKSGMKFYECETCKNRFSNKTSLKTHLNIHTNEKPYECEICKVRFNRRHNLKMHLKVHAKEKPYECEICKVRYRQKCHLNAHLRVHAKVKPHECEICKVRFNRKAHLQVHLKVHTKERPYECEICKVRFSQKGNLMRHVKRHTGEKPYKCEICEWKFIQKSALKSHFRIHTQVKSYKCNMCEIEFKNPRSLRIHIKSHPGKKKFECEICKLKFNQEGNLKVHLKIHTNEKPYECEVCKLKFSQMGNLKRHKRIHTGEKPYKCEICGKKFIQKVCLDSHFRTHTGETPYECEVCKKRFRDRSSLKVHLRVHTGEKPYECGICKVRFSQTGTLRTHLKIHM